MKTSLVVSSDMAFGELIHQNLEETGRFHASFAGDKPKIVSCVKETDWQLAFLDTCPSLFAFPSSWR